jgi:hypothetical protein
MVTGSVRDIVSVYEIPEYGCTKYLTTGCTKDDPTAFTGCVPNAIDDKDKCRCVIGFFDDLYGAC